MLELVRRVKEESQQCINAAGQELNVYIHPGIHAIGNNPPINCDLRAGHGTALFVSATF